jgi:hypothetical protein
MSNNTSTSKAVVKCYYVNEKKDRSDFTIEFTKGDVVWWDVASTFGDFGGTLPPFINVNGLGHLTGVNEFPVGASGFWTGNPPYDDSNKFKGELICFAVDSNDPTEQIDHNHLSGSATVLDYYTGTAAEYNAWAFKARNTNPGDPVGQAGQLDLNGVADPSPANPALPVGYDACPKFNLAHFTPNNTVLGTSVRTDDSSYGERDIKFSYYPSTQIALSSCVQDLRQDHEIHVSKAKLSVWNEEEVKLTGAWECVDSTEEFSTLYHDKYNKNHVDSKASVFDAHIVKTGAGVVKIQGVKSTVCDNEDYTTEDSAYIGVVTRPFYLVSHGDGECAQSKVYDGKCVDPAATSVTTRHGGVSLTSATDRILWDPSELCPGGGDTCNESN